MCRKRHYEKKVERRALETIEKESLGFTWDEYNDYKKERKALFG